MYQIEKITPKKFPPALLEIPQSPKELFVAGKIPDPEKYIFLTIVGSRHYSAYGREVCEKIVSGLAGQPIMIVSGLALGIDTIAHQSALEAGLITVAFPGSGLNQKVLYPSANRRLAEKIIENGGALVSEYQPDQIATLYTFPQRNRLMAGLSRATLIIEAGQKSGTLITARLATEYNRDVLAIPGSVFSPNSYGPNWLIKQGATPITEAEDILKHFSLKQESFDFDSAEKLADLSPSEKKIVELLRIEPLPRDELVFKAKVSASEANTVLSIMEIKGLIKESLGEFHLN